MTHYQLRDIGGALSWGALLHFVQFLPRTSALSREVAPPTEEERWMDGSMTAAILADVYDSLNLLRSEHASKGTGKKPKEPKPYPRPWVKRKNEQHVGADPIPISEFETWWASKEVT